MHIDAAFSCAGPVGFASEYRDGDDERPLSPVQVVQAFSNAITVHDRKPDVQQHHVRWMSYRVLDGGRAATGNLDLMTIQPKQYSHAFGTIDSVFNDQNI